MLRTMIALCLCLMLAACGGGGGGGGSGDGGKAVTPPLTNFTTLTVDDGPAELGTGTDPYRQVNAPFATITLCAPGTSTCQTIDHVLVDTGSVGLRLVRSVVTDSLAAAMTTETDASGNPVGECYGFVDGYVFGSVKQADFQIGGEKVANMPLELIGDSGAFATTPSECSSGGGSSIATVKDLGANGIIGIGTTPTDCGSYCQSGGYAAAIYYDCPSSGCGAIIPRTSTTAAPFQQLPNPVAAMTTDNNGTLIDMPAVAAAGAQTATGTLYFGIGTQTNNKLGSAKVLTTSTSTSSDGDGLLTATYEGQSLPDSFIDSGSNLYLFTDSAITGCTDDFAGYYCPASALMLTPQLKGQNGATADASFTLGNAQTLFATGDAAVPGVGGDAAQFDNLTPYPSSFDFGFPFFYGRKIYTAIEGRAAGGTAGPYVAF